jgi:hypothetical protein
MRQLADRREGRIFPIIRGKLMNQIIYLVGLVVVVLLILSFFGLR